MKTKRAKKVNLVTPVNEPLSNVLHHHNFAGIKRLLLMGSRLCPLAPVHIAVHQVGRSINRKRPFNWCYTDLHKHDFDEINVIWSERGLLEYKFEIDGQILMVKSPASVLIPAGVNHRAEVVRGRGSFFCILLRPITLKT